MEEGIYDIKGAACTDCKVMTRDVEPEALETIRKITDSEAFRGRRIRVMPDVHQGKGITIGFTSTLGGYVNPEHVGVDIGCTVSALMLDSAVPDGRLAYVERRLKETIPTGFRVHDVCVADRDMFLEFIADRFHEAKGAWPERLSGLPDSPDMDWLNRVLGRVGMDQGLFWCSLGTVGGGNHYMEYGEPAAQEGPCMFSVHCGSRNFGVKVANYWTRVAGRKTDKVDVKSLAEQAVRECGNDCRAIGPRLKELVREAGDALNGDRIPGYLSGEDMDGYLCDMTLAMGYAMYNHMTIHHLAEGVFAECGINAVGSLFTTHNYIDMEDHIIRKGAVNAARGRWLLVPMNMRDGTAVCIGLGDADWNSSCPHGAGRKMSRSRAMAELDLDEYRRQMDGICTTSVDRCTLDEAPGAYKDARSVLDRIDGHAVQVRYIVYPKINIKAAE